MPNLVAMIDQDGLISLIDRLARLWLELKKLDRGPSAIESAKRAGYDADSVTRLAAADQLNAVLSFLEDSEELAPELHQLLHALLDVERGRPVAWLQPAKKKGKPPPSFMDATAHARYAWVMDVLMEKGNKSEKEAANFVIEHGGLRRWLKPRSQKNSAGRLAGHRELA
jgi:hypothetical protein